MTMLRVKKGPCAPLRFSSMLSRPATGMTAISVMVGVTVILHSSTVCDNASSAYEALAVATAALAAADRAAIVHSEPDRRALPRPAGPQHSRDVLVRARRGRGGGSAQSERLVCRDRVRRALEDRQSRRQLPADLLRGRV